MARDKNNTYNIELKGIELLSLSLDMYAEATKRLVSFKYLLDIETKINAREKLIYKIVSVQIQNHEQSVVYGSVKASCIFYLSEFAKLVNIKNLEIIDMPGDLSEELDSISISTLRGIMFSELKGTFLHNAVLPVIHSSIG